MFRPRLLFCAAMITGAIGYGADGAFAQSAQYPQPSALANNTELALSPPSAASGMQMLRSEASVLFSSGQYLAAAEVYKRLLQLGSMDAADRYWLGESLYHANNFQQAATAFEQAIQLNAKFSQAYVRLTETYLALHQKDKAMQICNTGLNAVTDPYMKEQLSNLLKVAFHQESKPIRARNSRASRLPSES